MSQELLQFIEGNILKWCFSILLMSTLVIWIKYSPRPIFRRKNDDEADTTSASMKRPLLTEVPQVRVCKNNHSVLSPDTSFEKCGCHNPFVDLVIEELLQGNYIPALKDELKCNDNEIIRNNSSNELEKEDDTVLLITGGCIRPFSHGDIDKTVEAIGIVNGAITLAGDRDDVIKSFHGKKFDEKQLKNNETLIPGLIDPHVHFVTGVTIATWIDATPFEGQELRKKYDLEWLQNQIRARKHQSVILGYGLDPSLMPLPKQTGNMPRLQDLMPATLDAMVEDVPILLLSASEHTVYLNTLAARQTYDSNSALRREYRKFEDFLKVINKNGGLQEMARQRLCVKIVPSDVWIKMGKGFEKSIKEYVKSLHSLGVTSIYDASMSPGMRKMINSHQLELRIGCAVACLSLADAQKIRKYTPPTQQNVVGHLYDGHAKIVSDGSNQGLTGYQHNPYNCEPANNNGAFNFPPFSHPLNFPKEYQEIVDIVHDKGWPLMIHANGDCAVDYTVEAIANVKGKRHECNRIEHCSLLSDETIQKIAELNISPSFLIGHVGFWGHVFSSDIFGEKAQILDRCKSCADAGVRFTLHSDNNVTPVGPLRAVEQAVTRIMEGDPQERVLNPNERITIQQGLRAVTYDAAWQCRMDSLTGSLEKGKLGDFIILEKDPVSMTDFRGLRHLTVLETWINGKRVFKK